MATIILKNSNSAAHTPTTGQLSLGELAVNTRDGKIFMKKNDGVESIIEIGEIGGGVDYLDDIADVALATSDLADRQVLMYDLPNELWTNMSIVPDIVATIQTHVTAGPNITVEPDSNGVLVISSTSSVENIDDIADVVLDSNLSAGQILVYDGTNWVNEDNTFSEISTFSYVGDGSTVAYDLDPVIPVTKDHTDIFIGGVYQRKETYTLLGSVITLSAPAPLDEPIEITVISTQLSIVSVSDGSITYAKIQNVAANTLLGRGGTSGIVQEIVLSPHFAVSSGELVLGEIPYGQIVSYPEWFDTFTGSYNDLTDLPDLLQVSDLAAVADTGSYNDLIDTPTLFDGDYNNLYNTPSLDQIPGDSDSIGEGTLHLFMTSAEKTKLSGIATGATANDTDSNLKNRANHTGSQTASTISDFSTAVNTLLSGGTSGNVVVNGTVTATGAIVAPVAINTQTGPYSLVLADAGKYVRVDDTLTVPLNSSHAFPVGTQIYIKNLAAGPLTIAATGGVTINTPETLIISKQYASAVLIKVGTNEWDLEGNLEPL